MTELPKPDLVFGEDFDANTKSLYRLIYDAQSSADNREELVCSRIVGYLLLHPISSTARGAVLKELASIVGLHDAQTSSKIHELGKMYLDHLIRPCESSFSYSPQSPSFRNSQNGQGENPSKQFVCFEGIVL